MGALGLTSWGVSHPFLRWRRDSHGGRYPLGPRGAGNLGLGTGLARARRGQPEGPCRACWKLLGCWRGVRGLGQLGRAGTHVAWVCVCAHVPAVLAQGTAGRPHRRWWAFWV